VSGFEIVPYEPARRADFLALMREVYEGAGWSEQEFDWWFEQNPAGRFSVSLAEVDGRVVGAAAHSTARWVLGGRDADVAATHHVMTSPAARGKGVFSALEVRNDERSAEAGAAAAFGFSNDASTPIFVGRLGWERVCGLRLWARPKRPIRAARRLRAHASPAGGVRGAVEEFGPRHEEIYRRAAPGWGSHVVKSAEYLNWRYRASPRPYASFSTARGFAVVGWNVFKGISAGLVCELVGGDGLRLLRRCVRAADADVVLAAPNAGERGLYLAAGFLPTNAEIHLVGLPFQPGVSLPRGRDAYRFSLGDSDVF